MKIVCYKDKILKAINSVVKAVASKTTMPILEGILIQTNDNEIKLTTYDLEIGIEYIMDCTVEEQGSTVVNAIMFSEIIRKLPDTEINISVNSNNLLEIECEGALYRSNQTILMRPILLPVSRLGNSALPPEMRCRRFPYTSGQGSYSDSLIPRCCRFPFCRSFLPPA